LRLYLAVTLGLTTLAVVLAAGPAIAPKGVESVKVTTLELTPANTAENLFAHIRLSAGIGEENRALKQVSLTVEVGTNEIIIASVFGGASKVDIHLEKKNDQALTSEALDSKTYRMNQVSFNTKQSTQKIDFINTPALSNLKNYSYCLRSLEYSFISSTQLKRINSLWDATREWRAPKTNDPAAIAQNLMATPEFQKLHQFLEALVEKNKELLDELSLANSKAIDSKSCQNPREVLQAIKKIEPDSFKDIDSMEWRNTDWLTYNNKQRLLVPIPFLSNWIIGNVSRLKKNSQAIDILDVTDGFGEKGLKLQYSHLEKNLDYIKANTDLGLINFLVNGYILMGVGGTPTDVLTTRSKINIFFGGDEEVFSFRLN